LLAGCLSLFVLFLYALFVLCFVDFGLFCFVFVSVRVILILALKLVGVALGACLRTYKEKTNKKKTN